MVPNVPVMTEYLPFMGGLDIETPALSVSPGSLLACSNYDPDAMGGYRRIAGYERFDGRSRPSDAVATEVGCTLSSTPPAGSLLTIGAVTCYFVRLTEGGMLVCNATGTIPANTNIVFSGVIGQTSAAPLLTSARSTQDEAELAVACADVMRAFIGQVPGSGPVRGVHSYKGQQYAFRNNAGGTACVMHRATTSGWTTVALGEVLEFTNATALLADGATLTQGAVSATVGRMVVETGSITSGVNTGRLFIRNRVGGNFVAGVAGTLTLAGAQTAVQLPAGGRYEFENYAFSGAESALRMYAVNGVGQALEFDGTTLVLIRTGSGSDAPKFVKANRGYLFLAQGSSVTNSSAGDPYRFVVAEGASEIAVGDTITGLAVLAGEALGIFSRNKSQALTGASPAEWTLQTIRSDVGALAYSVQTMSDTYMLDDRGILSVSTSDQYGNFADATLSRKIQRLIKLARTNLVGSYVSRQGGHYKLMLSDGTTLTMGITNNKLVGFTAGKYEFSPYCLSVLDGEDGEERTFVGAADGYVYELNRGSTFDGGDIESYIKVFYVSNKSPEVRKRYRRVTLEMSALVYALIQFQAEYSYGDIEIQQTASRDISVSGPGGSWDFANWDEFYWDGQDVARPSFTISGSGVNMAMTFYSKTKLDAGHVLAGAILHYTPRRLQRT